MAGFENLKRQTMADSVYDQMRAAILSGSIEAGQELNQVELAQQFNVSRVPVREALNRLHAERLITAAPYQRYVVSVLSPDSLIELLDIRAELESFAVRRLAGRADAASLSTMRSINLRLRSEEDSEAWLTGDFELHQYLDDHGSETSRLVLDLRSRVHRYLTGVASTRERQSQACDEHERIIAAIAAGDADEAEAAMREHISHSQSVITAAYVLETDSTVRAR